MTTDEHAEMKAVVALGIVIVMGVVGFWLSSPLFDAAAHDLCGAYAEIQGWELVDASGHLGRQKRSWFTPDTPDYWCRFEDEAGQAVFLDELDRVMPVTWRSRGLRLAGWAAIVTPLASGVALSGWAGLLRGDDD